MVQRLKGTLKDELEVLNAGVSGVNPNKEGGGGGGGGGASGAGTPKKMVAAAGGTDTGTGTPRKRKAKGSAEGETTPVAKRGRKKKGGEVAVGEEGEMKVKEEVEEDGGEA